MVNMKLVWVMVIAVARAAEKQRDYMTEGAWETPELASLCLAHTEEIVEAEKPDALPFLSLPTRPEAELPLPRASFAMEQLSSRDQMMCSYQILVHNFQCDLTKAKADAFVAAHDDIPQGHLGRRVVDGVGYKEAIRELTQAMPPPKGEQFWSEKGANGKRQFPSIKLDLEYFAIHSFNPEPEDKTTPVMSGVISMKWNDSRLAHDKDRSADTCFKSSRIVKHGTTGRPFLANVTVHYAALAAEERIHGVGGLDLWAPTLVPPFGLMNGDTIDQAKFFVNTIDATGYVNGHAFFHMYTPRCQTDFRSFPHDVHDCCFRFMHFNGEGMVAINILNQDHFALYDSSLSPGWSLLSKNLTSEPMFAFTSMDEDEPLMNGTTLTACVRVRRSSAALTFRYSVPLATAIVVAVFAPLFGGWVLQIAFKSLALALITVYMQFVVDLPINFGDQPPFFIAAYQFLLGTTVASLVITLLFWGLSKQTHRLPLPRQLLWVSELGARLCPCAESSAKDDGLANAAFAFPVDPEDGELAPQATMRVMNGGGRAGGSEWRGFWAALNSIASAVVTVVYVIGLLVIYNRA